ncbi:protein YgfX [Halomonas alimentaria]|uniref:protein YgfX n=1 Tax=Halomonas alimentaria TaxID=147248 RepID=UPI0031ECA48A
MPRAPTACRIGRSRLALLVHLLPVAAVAGLLATVLALWWWLPVALGLGAITFWCVRDQPQGELSAEALPGGGLQWKWRDAGDTAPRPVSLRCDYLGPWLVGLRLNGRRLWLWPDSCSPSAHRELRRYLVRH